MNPPKFPLAPQDAALVRSLANLAAKTHCWGRSDYSALGDGYSLGLIAAAKYVALHAKCRARAAQLAQPVKTYVLD